MKRLGFYILLCVMSAWQAYGWSGLNLKAKEAEQANDYVSAANLWERHAAEIADSMSANPSSTMLRDLIMAISNQSNCAYMIDDYRSLDRLISEYDSIANLYVELVDDDLYYDYLAYRHKNVGSYLYGQLDDYPSLFSTIESEYQRALDTADPTDEEFSRVNQQELAQLYYKKGLMDKQAFYFQKALDALKQADQSTPRSRSEMAITKARIGQYTANDSEASQWLDEAVSDIEAALKKFPTKDPEYPELLREKGKILMLQQERLGVSNSAQAKKCYQQYLDLKKTQIANTRNSMTESQLEQAWLGMHQFLYDACRLEDAAPDAIYDLLLYSKGYLLRPAKSSVVTWKQVAKKLAKDECAIEFVIYDDNIAALLINSKSKKPQWINLGNADDILNLQLATNLTVADAISSSAHDDKDCLYTDQRLPEKIWNSELTSAIGSCDKVYFSPDGFLHQLAIEYLVPDSAAFVPVRLSSTARLTQPRISLASAKALLCGGVDYQNQSQYTNRTFIDNDTRALEFLKGRVREVSYLPGSQIEIDSISQCRNNAQDILFSGAAATEEGIRQKSSDYDILHLSTHGYFAGNATISTDLKPRIADSSLSESGLLLAGAENGILHPQANRYDGVLSAQEMARSNWDGVKLAVMSACQTALGYVTADGVYGMQRGLKMAGVDGMIVSLWSVDDNATCNLMKFFYQFLSDPQLTPAEAFQAARQELKTTGYTQHYFNFATLSVEPVTVAYDTPRFCCPFITIDLF